MVMYALAWFIFGFVGSFAALYNIGRMQEKYYDESFDSEVTIGTVVGIAGFGIFGPVGVFVLYAILGCLWWEQLVGWYRRNRNNVVYTMKPQTTKTSHTNDSGNNEHPLK